MSAIEVQIPLFERTNRAATRREERSALVRRVEYCRFPRVCADQRLRVAFTLDISNAGLCVHGSEAEPVGALLRLSVQGVDGSPGPEQLARVAWSGTGTSRTSSRISRIRPLSWTGATSGSSRPVVRARIAWYSCSCG